MLEIKNPRDFKIHKSALNGIRNIDNRAKGIIKNDIKGTVSMSIKSVPVIITKSVPVAAKNFNS